MFNKTPFLLLPLLIGSLIPNQQEGFYAEGTEEGDPNPAGLHLFQVESPFGFHTVLQEKYLRDGNNSIEKYAKGEAELSRPDALKVEWRATKLSDKAKPSYILTISENEDLSNPWVYSVNTNYAYVYNLKLATRYYYSVQTTFGGKTSTSEKLWFRTENNMVRNLNLDGVINARDCGGWRNSDGQFMVKQGMLYRSGPFNRSNSSKVETTVSVEGRKEAARLGIKTEIDLREVKNNEVGGLKNNTKSVLSYGSNNVKYIQAPINWANYSPHFLKDECSETLKTVFHTLADESNYPVIFHCTAGTDRTGMIAYLVNGLLGVSEADLYRDYFFSLFSNIGLRYRKSIDDFYVAEIKKFPGATLQSKIFHALKDAGVPEEDLYKTYYLLQEEGYRI